MLLNCGIGEDSWESLGLQGDQTSQSSRKSVLIIHWKDWCWSWNSNTLLTWCEELTHWKRPWCQERVKARGEGGNRGWNSWMASLILGSWVWASSGSWCWTGKPGVLQSMGSQRIGHDWAAEQQQQIIKSSVFSVEQACPVHCDAIDCNSLGSSIPGIFQAKILEQVAISFSRGSSQPRDQTCYSCIGRQILYHWATREWSSQISVCVFLILIYVIDLEPIQILQDNLLI